MKIHVTLKGKHQEFLNRVVRDYSLGGSDQAIRSLIQYSLSQNGHDQILGEIRCVGECRSADQSIPVELEDEAITTLKEILQQYDFDDYDSRGGGVEQAHSMHGQFRGSGGKSERDFFLICRSGARPQQLGPVNTI